MAMRSKYISKERNLAFLIDFLDKVKSTRHEQTKALGVSQQALFWYVKQDDILLSKLEDYISKMGYKIDIILEYERQEYYDDLDCEFEIEEDNGAQLKPNRLGFLEKALKDLDIRKSELLPAIGYTYAGVLRMFRVDDMYFSNLRKICKYFDIRLRIKIHKDKSKELERFDDLCDVDEIKELREDEELDL